MLGIVIGGMAMEVVLAVLLFFYGSSTGMKVVVCVILLLIFLACLASVCMLYKSLKLGSIFLKAASDYVSHAIFTLFYIILFMALTLGFLSMLIIEYTGLISIMEPTFDNTSLYYESSTNSMIFSFVVLFVQLLWGLSFLKEACKAIHI